MISHSTFFFSSASLSSSHQHFNAAGEVDSNDHITINDYGDANDADDDAYQVPINQSSRAGVPEAVVKRAIA